MNPTGTAQEVERVSDERLEEIVDTWKTQSDEKYLMARELQRLRAASDEGWVRTEDAYPKDGERVLCLSGDVQSVFEYRDDGRPSRFYWFAPMSNKFPREYVTHWRPLLSPPSEAPRKDVK